MNITDEMVESGARALYESQRPGWEAFEDEPWCEWDQFADKDEYRRAARLVLEAALPEDDTEWEYGIRLDAYPDADVVPMASEIRAKAHASVDGVTAMRRTVTAGPWEPVPTEEGDS